MEHPVDAHAITWACVEDWYHQTTPPKTKEQFPFKSFKFEYLRMYYANFWPDCLTPEGSIDFAKYDAYVAKSKITRYINRNEPESTQTT